MRIAISNIAWDVCEDEQIALLLTKYHVDAIDIAPGKYFPDPIRASIEDIREVRTYWSDKGIEITGMQSLLFGTQGLNIFSSTRSRQSMLTHLTSICRIASGLGATRLVFGSPKNRDRLSLTNEQAVTVAMGFFKELGDIASQFGVTICLEPNPTCYGANFMTDARETHDVVMAINHSAIKMQLDTGAITINNESISTVLSYARHHIGHIHISEPNLAVVGDLETNHTLYAKIIAEYFGDPLITIEMVATKESSHMPSVERALQFVTRHYRDISCTG